MLIISWTAVASSLEIGKQKAWQLLGLLAEKSVLVTYMKDPEKYPT